MTNKPPARSDFESLKGLLLEVARKSQTGGLHALLALIVQRLAEQPHVALARIWLMAPGDVCSSCEMRPECPDQTACLHLVASAGNPEAQKNADWSRIDGSFRRFPIGVRKVGHTAATREAVTIRDMSADSRWVANPQWVRDEGIIGFGAQPLIYRGEVLGVQATFTRIFMEPEEMVWLRLIADHVAAAIANTRAFEEIKELREKLELENEYLRDEISEAHSSGDMVGESSSLKKSQEQIELVAPTDASVLILGESGTGKELVARAIHERSKRRDRPLIKVNCASIPGELFESEFFGHARGAFTGAVRDRVGRFELAHEGTLFLDEVGDIPAALQSKLLRVLQEGTFERIGEEQTRQVDVRVIAATNRDLKEDVDQKLFREDLYYRLSVFPIELTPLRAREGDIPLLAEFFLRQTCKRMGIATLKLKKRHVLQLQGYDWPGNVRELQNVVERAVINTPTRGLEFGLPEANSRGRGRRPQPAAGAEPGSEVENYAVLKKLERDMILAALEQVDWKVAGSLGAGKLLGVKPTTLRSRMQVMGIRRWRHREP